MFQFPSFATPSLCIQPGVSWTFIHVGFPIRISTDRCLFTAPRRFSQFYHVLHRLLVPRHPPNALTSLTTKTLCLLIDFIAETDSLRSGRWPSRLDN